MSVLARRREAECASDLRFDRWLLGESPGSDEARQLERHVAECGECASRLKSLRSLYSASTVPSTPPRPKPVRVAAAGLMQVIILRDGLLVGTEMFSAGEWIIGAVGADLELEELTALRHARLRFHEGQVSAEADAGPLYINGNRVRGGLLRPIDELQLGPWTLRARVVTDRWDERSAPRLLAVAPVPEVIEAKTEIVHRAERPVLKLELRWGAQRLAVRSFDAQPVPASLFEPLGAGLLKVEPEGTGYRVFWGRARLGELVAPGAPLELEGAGGLTLGASLVEREAKVARGPLVQLPRLVVVLAMLFACVPVGLSFVDAPVDDRFEPRRLPSLPVHPMRPPPKEPPVSAPPSESSASTKTRSASRSPAQPSRFKVPSLPKGLTGSIAGIEVTLRNLGVGKGHATGARGGSLVAGLPSGNSLGGSIGLGAGSSPVGIGSAGALSSGRTGRGAVVGRVTDGERSLRVTKDSNGTIDRDSVAKVIRDHTSEISACYETALLTQSGLRGSAKLEWRIDTSGTVASVRLLGATLRDSGAVTGCIMSKLKTWRFPPARGGPVIVSNNFVFEQSAF